MGGSSWLKKVRRCLSDGLEVRKPTGGKVRGICCDLGFDFEERSLCFVEGMKLFAFQDVLKLA